jgi:hypothetical protein
MTSPVTDQTEAELQSRFETAIRTVLPLLSVEFKLERFLHLKLGHHEIGTDGFKPLDAVRGRYDMLLVSGGQPLLLIELKAPDVTITEDDVRQALSYARLHPTPVPLVLVTNGSTGELRRGYDGAKLDPSDVGQERLANVLAKSAALAVETAADAVRTLLSSSRETWTQILGKWSDEAIDERTGNASDCRRPIVREFTIRRDLVAKADTWVPHRVSLITEDEDGIPWRRSQSPWLCMSYALTFREPAISRLSGYLSEIGEILPLECDDGPLFIWQPLTVVDALDARASDIVRFKSGRLMRVRRHVFVGSKLAGIDAFKIPDDGGFEAFFTERAVEIISSVVGTDIDFKLLWSEE